MSTYHWHLIGIIRLPTRTKWGTFLTSSLIFKFKHMQACRWIIQQSWAANGLHLMSKTIRSSIIKQNQVCIWVALNIISTLQLIREFGVRGNHTLPLYNHEHTIRFLNFGSEINQSYKMCKATLIPYQKTG